MEVFVLFYDDNSFSAEDSLIGVYDSFDKATDAMLENDDAVKREFYPDEKFDDESKEDRVHDLLGYVYTIIKVPINDTSIKLL